MIIFWFLVTTYSAVAFEFKCPHSSQRRFRAIGVCQNESKYSCLLDIIDEVYIEMCNQTADFVARGEKYVISGRRRSDPCSSDRYQPFKFWINVQSMCYYKKSLCNENAQILYRNLSTINDDMCLCNYTSGYGFVTKPRNPCYCIPFQEDCTCYRIPCPAKNNLTADETCRINNIFRVEFQAVVPRMNTFSPNINQIFDADHLAVKRKFEAFLLALTIITLVLVAVIIVLLKCDSHSTPIPTLSTVSGQLQTGPWRNKRVEFVLKICNGRSLVIPERIKYCSKWFMQEFGLYPDPKTLDFLPVTEDVFYRVQRSVKSGGFINVMKTYLHGEDVICHFQHPRQEIEACLLVDRLSKSDSVTDTSLDNPLKDYSQLLSFNEDVVLEEIQPALVKKKFLKKGIKLSTDISPSRKRNDTAIELLAEIQTKELSNIFVEMLKNDESYTYNRLNSFFFTFARDTSLDNPLNDYSLLLSLLEDVVLDEIQPAVVKKNFSARGIELSTDINPNRNRNDTAKDLLAEIKTTNNLSTVFVEMLKNEESYTYKRLKSFILTFDKDSNVQGNIVSNMVDIVETKIDVDAFISYFVNRKVFDDNFDIVSREYDQAITQLMFMILQKGKLAIGFFLDALYFYDNADLADRLLLTKTEQHFEHSSTYTAVMHETEEKNVLLKKRMVVNIC